VRRNIAFFLAALLLAPVSLPAQTGPEAEEKRLAEIQAKRARGEQPTAEEQEFYKQVQSRRREGFARNNPPRESTGAIPLTDLGTGAYKGEPGGLYPDGKNELPAAHRNAGLAIAKAIAPIDGKIGMLSIGMSNTTQEFQVFMKLASADPRINPHLVIVDGAQGGQAADTTANPNAKYWDVVAQRLQAAGVSPQQVQVAWLKQAIIAPRQPFPAEAKRLQSYLAQTLLNAKARYPNLKIVYLSSRIYAGYALTPLNPEPHAYEDAFAVKWLIADQIAGNPELNFDSAKGVVRAPWIAWGPYLWSDGVKPRGDGLVYLRGDLEERDGTHPSMGGREKVARLLLDFLRSSPTSRPWFLKPN